jgi:hypothetical protein
LRRLGRDRASLFPCLALTQSRDVSDKHWDSNGYFAMPTIF